MGDFRLIERTFSIYWMDLVENGKISLKGILLFRVRVVRERVAENESISARERWFQ